MGIFLSGYVCVHLLTNASVLDSALAFQRRVNAIHSLGPALPLVEWTFIFIPLIFHAVVGWAIISGAHFNTSSYHNFSNWRFTFQRVTAVILFFFILAHILHMHHMGHSLGGGRFDPDHAASSAANALQGGGLLVQLAYAVGVLAAAFHVGNGLWTFGITWGIWTTPAAQMKANLLTLLVFVMLSTAGLGALVGIRQLDPVAAKLQEDRLLKVESMVEGAESAADSGKSLKP
jgi:succinate dehydrogenase / fumarate reductase cytochrome b subunit